VSEQGTIVATEAGRGSMVSGLLDLNLASAVELEQLPGIGPSLAAAIISYREQSGPFRSVEDLLNVPGIGATRLSQLRELVRVD
jgi:competence protein ComEA